MSSACVCHTNEWCFFCEMYSPLEADHNKIRNGIRQVMASLANKATVGYFSASAYDKGTQHAYETAIKMLEEVMASEQVPVQENGDGRNHL